jgi:hypothetical protein
LVPKKCRCGERIVDERWKRWQWSEKYLSILAAELSIIPRSGFLSSEHPRATFVTSLIHGSIVLLVPVSKEVGFVLLFQLQDVLPAQELYGSSFVHRFTSLHDVFVVFGRKTMRLHQDGELVSWGGEKLRKGEREEKQRKKGRKEKTLKPFATQDTAW